MNLKSKIISGLTALVLACGASDSVGANVSAKSLPSSKSLNATNQYSFANVYDECIRTNLAYFESKHGVAPDSNLVKAIIIEETGSKAFRETAFVHDPMQIANEGDYALRVLSDGEESTKLIGNFSILKDKKNTPRKEGKWDYSKSNLSAQDSIFGGIGWLFSKAAIYGSRSLEEGEIDSYVIKKGDSLSKIAQKEGTTVQVLEKYNPGIEPRSLKIGQSINVRKAKRENFIKGWKSWDEAVQGYNGSGNPNYLAEVKSIKNKLDKIKP